MLCYAKSCLVLSQYEQSDMEKSITLLLSIIYLALLLPSNFMISGFIVSPVLELTGGLTLGVPAPGELLGYPTTVVLGG